MKLIIDVIKILIQDTLMHININRDQRHFLLTQIKEILPQLYEKIEFSLNETREFEYSHDVRLPDIPFANLKLNHDIIKELFPTEAFQIRSLYRIYIDTDPQKVQAFFKDNQLNDDHSSLFYQAIKDLREAIRITMNIEPENSSSTVHQHEKNRYCFHEKKILKPTIGPIIGWTTNGLK
jgi:hypothetical protein